MENNMNNTMSNDEHDLNMATNHKFFTNSLNKLLDIISEKSKEIIKVFQEKYDPNSQTEVDFTKTNKYKAHMKLQETCDIIKNGFNGKNENFEQGKLIKKIYRTLTSNLKLFYPDSNISLFTVKNNKNEVVSIIPGIDINLIIRGNQTTEEDMKQIWGNLYMLYISSANMIDMCNTKKKNPEVMTLLNDMRKTVFNMGILEFNPFIGLNTETGEYTIDKLYESIKNDDFDKQNINGKIPLDNVLKMFGLDKMFDMKKISKDLEDGNVDYVSETSSSIAKLIGTDDEESRKIYSSLAESTIEQIKLQNANGNGNFDFFEIAKNVAENVKSKIEMDKLNKMSSTFMDFINNSNDKFKDMKDDDGNPIGEKIMNTLNIAKMMGGN